MGLLYWGWATSLLYGNISMLVLVLVWTIGAVFIAKKEEKFLEEVFGQEWIKYKEETPFFGFWGRR